MKTIIVSKFLVALLISISFVSCGPTAVAVRTRPSTPVYVRPAAPSSTHIWVGDSWNWRNNRYNYQPGYWTAPRPRQVYVNGYWRNNRRGTYWVPGHWQRR
jgi:hypothetical protein